MTLYIVSRHTSTQEFLADVLGAFEDNIVILEHLNSVEEIPLRSKVAGNLPFNLIAELVNKRYCIFYYVSIEVPREMRGQELDIEALKKYAKIYKIIHISMERVY